MSGLSVSSSSSLVYGPYANLPQDMIREIVSHSDPMTIVKMSQVCRAWRAAFPEKFWYDLSDTLGVPRVISSDGKPRNLREDFNKLYPITFVSGEKIRKFLGDPVGPVPPIKEEVFNMLDKLDPWESILRLKLWEPRKKIRQTFVLVVDYKSIKKAIDENSHQDLQDMVKPIESSVHSSSSSSTITNEFEKQENEDEIPLTFPNLVTLCKHPLRGEENGPVFAEIDRYILSNYNGCPEETSVFLMRKCVVEKNGDSFFLEKERLIADKGFYITSLKVRSLFDAICILSSGNCPDNRNLSTYAYTGYMGIAWGGRYVMRIGNFAPGFGSCVLGCSGGRDLDSFGVVPCIQGGGSCPTKGI